MRKAWAKLPSETWAKLAAMSASTPHRCTSPCAASSGRRLGTWMRWTRERMVANNRSECWVTKSMTVRSVGSSMSLRNLLAVSTRMVSGSQQIQTFHPSVKGLQAQFAIHLKRLVDGNEQLFAVRTQTVEPIFHAEIGTFESMASRHVP